MRFAKKILPIALLLILSSSCIDLSINLDYDLYVLELGVAHCEKGAKPTFLMDDSTWLYPRNEVNADVENGKRYKIHYATHSFNKQGNEFSAEVLDIIPVPVLNVSLFPDPSFLTQEELSVDIDRFWVSGGFLNVSFNCETLNQQEAHFTQFVRSDFSDKNIHLRMYHFREQIEGTHASASSNHTLSIPLSQMSDYLSGGKAIYIEVYENNKRVNYTIKALSPIGK